MAAKRENEITLGGLNMWIEDGKLYIQRKDGQTVVLDPKQATRLGNDLIAISKNGVPMTVDFAEYGEVAKEKGN